MPETKELRVIVTVDREAGDRQLADELAFERLIADLLEITSRYSTIHATLV
jgi:hypothetical protein